MQISLFFTFRLPLWELKETVIHLFEMCHLPSTVSETNIIVRGFNHT